MDRSHPYSLLDWYSLQLVLADTPSDVLVLLSACYSGNAATLHKNDIKYLRIKRMEVMSSSAYGKESAGNAFLKTVILELLRRANSKAEGGTVFSTSQLFGGIIQRSIQGASNGGCQYAPHAPLVPAHDAKNCWSSPVHVSLTPGNLGNIVLRSCRSLRTVTISEDIVDVETSHSTETSHAEDKEIPSRCKTSPRNLIKQLVPSWAKKISARKSNTQEEGN